EGGRVRGRGGTRLGGRGVRHGGTLRASGSRAGRKGRTGRTAGGEDDAGIIAGASAVPKPGTNSPLPPVRISGYTCPTCRKPSSPSPRPGGGPCSLSPPPARP